MSEDKIVWSSSAGDLRKRKTNNNAGQVNEEQIELKIRRLTSGKGRTVIEITGLPNNQNWNKKLAKDLKKSLGVGGAYKNDFIEIHGEKFDEVINILTQKSLRWKKTGG